MNEQDPQPQNPELIAHVPLQGIVEVTPVTEPAGEQLYGGYTGVNVGQMANRIGNLRAAGKNEEANALQEQLDKVAPAIPNESEPQQ